MLTQKMLAIARVPPSILTDRGLSDREVFPVEPPVEDPSIPSLEAVNSLDLTKVKKKVMEKQGWTQAEADDAEKWYRRFLKLIVLHPSAALVPNEAIDEMWHGHILDTRKYSRDCDDVFGGMLHHKPSYGQKMGGESFEDTNNLFKREFGEGFYLMTESPKNCRKDCMSDCCVSRQN